MHPLGITEQQKEKKKLFLIKKSRTITTLFVISLFLPLLVVLLFKFQILKSRPSYSLGLEEPVAKLVTPSGIGTAFLVSETLLITARHVVSDLDIGEEVILEFQKADPPKQITGRILFYESSTLNPIDARVPIDYFLTDIAIIEIPPIEDILPVELGDSEFIEELDEIILVGYPNNDYSKTDGSINSKSYQGLDFFKSDITANRGNSGGPTFLKDDLTVIGIIVGSGDPNDQGENIIIKINNAISFLESNNISIY